MSIIYQSVDGRKRIKMKPMTENIAGTCVCSKCTYVIKSNFVPIERVNVDSRKRIKRDLTKTGRRRQQERQKSNGFNEKDNNAASASRFFVHFLAVPAQLRREITKF